MEPKDILEPRVFLCKAGRFLENINSEMDPDGGTEVRRERFGGEDFEQSCDPTDLRSDPNPADSSNPDSGSNDSESYDDPENQGTVIIADDYDYPENEPEIVEVKGDERTGVHDLPILVFVGLPDPEINQNEAQLVESIISKSADLPKSSVRTALRLPIQDPSGKSMVIVEMDTIENEEKVLEKIADIQKISNTKDVRFNPKLDHVGIRKAKYKELWRLVEELTIAKRVVIPSNIDIVPETGDNLIENDESNTTTEKEPLSEEIVIGKDQPGNAEDEEEAPK